jgi:hypothetical protein
MWSRTGASRPARASASVRERLEEQVADDVDVSGHDLHRVLAEPGCADVSVHHALDDRHRNGARAAPEPGDGPPPRAACSAEEPGGRYGTVTAKRERAFTRTQLVNPPRVSRDLRRGRQA